MTTLPVAIHNPSSLSGFEGGVEFQQFVRQAMQAPLLSQEEEYELASRFQEKQDLEAAHQLVHAYLRLVLKTAREYLGYRMSLPDLVQEGTVGLMHAVKKFDPKRGNRLSSYAIWWIRAAIHDFILSSWRLVKIATTQIKRKLFFKLRQTKTSAAPLNHDEAQELAYKFGTDAETILEVDGRMSGSDESLNQPLMEDDSGEWIDSLADQRPNQEHELISIEQKQQMQTMIQQGLDRLKPREQQILATRYLDENPQTLDSLAQTFSVSRERIRQIEKRALEKLRAFILETPGGEMLATGV